MMVTEQTPDSFVDCAYSGCNKTIPDGARVMKSGDDYYCSDQCLMMTHVNEGKSVNGVEVIIRYSGDDICSEGK